MKNITFPQVDYTNMLKNLKIKNGDGDFVNFSGVRKTSHHCYVKIRLSNITREIKTSLNHKFIVDGKEIEAMNLRDGDKLSDNNYVVFIDIIKEKIDLYEPVEVEKTHTFIHDRELVSHNCSFIGSSDTLIAPDTLLGLKAKDPIKLINDVRYYDAAEEGHKYIMTVDVSKGRGQDYSTFNVIDVTQSPFKQVAVYRNNNISPLLFPDIIVRVAHQYNDALVIIENNDAGHVVCNAVYHEYEYENMFVESAVKAMGIGCTMTKRVKRVGCSNLKDIVESGKLTINDADTIQELASFEAKGTSYEASGSNNDDLVMNLVMFSWFASTDMFKESSSVDLKNLLFSERLREMEDDVVPFGIFPDNNDGPDMSIYQEMIDEQKEWNLL